jgi:outer membrane protein OmpA-like peptidoglycan-associated protein
MKIQTLLTLALAAGISAAVGCRNPKAIHSVLPNTSATADHVALTPGDGSRLNLGNETGGPVITELPNDDKLRGRDFDRTTFAQETVYFEYDRSTLRADEASKIEQVSGVFKGKGADFDLLIEGHCDERGTEEYNRSLGDRRALTIRELLMKSGVDGKRIFTRSFGKDQPALVGHDEGAWSKNRRGEFVLVLPKKLTTTQNTK